jgi:hypothetical protein
VGPSPEELAKLSPAQRKQLLEMAASTQDYLFARAREDVNLFAELVMVDDVTGQAIRQAPIHRRWHALADEFERLLIWSHIESGKTTQLSVLRTVWELGRDPSLRFAIISNTARQSTKIVRAIARLIENNAVVRKVFPLLRPDPAGPWTHDQLRVLNESYSKDPCVQGLGVHGAITGARIDRLVMDDMLDPENTRTAYARKELEDWVNATLLGRLTKRARVLVVGTAYHPEDLLHRLSTRGYKWVRFPVINDRDQLTWESNWDRRRIEAKQQELGPLEFARQMLCRARNDEQARFRKEWIDDALRRGAGIEYVYQLPAVPEGCSTYTGVDLAVQRHSKADDTAFFTFIQSPKGERQVLNIESGKWTGPDIVDRIVKLHERYHSIVMVENNAAQDFILQFARDVSSVPIRPFTTGKQKASPEFGVESLAVEMFNGKWVIPNDNGRVPKDVTAWMMEMLYYDPGSHTGDRLMASYLAREAARKPVAKAKGNVRFTSFG